MMSKFLFYVIFIVVSGVVLGLVIKITNLPNHFWSYAFAAGFVLGSLLELFSFFYKKVFPDEKLFGGKKRS
jgi:hypothetical protein